MEAAFLKALDFKTNALTMAGGGEGAKYFFALEDVLTYKNGAKAAHAAGHRGRPAAGTECAPGRKRARRRDTAGAALPTPVHPTR